MAEYKEILELGDKVKLTEQYIDDLWDDEMTRQDMLRSGYPYKLPERGPLEDPVRAHCGTYTITAVHPSLAGPSEYLYELDWLTPLIFRQYLDLVD